jgi:hypothetical protein
VSDRWGVHISHCCLFHGCKYGDDDCPVYLAKTAQEHPCEDCDTREGTHLHEDELHAVRSYFAENPEAFQRLTSAISMEPRAAANLARKLAPQLLSAYLEIIFAT